MSCNVWCAAAAAAAATAVHVSVKLFSNDMNEIYVTDELGCGGHCSIKKIKYN